MKPSVEQLGNLLATRRIERPEEGYWQDFLGEFHRRQREQVVPESGLLAVWHRMKELASDLGSAKWAYGAGLAYAAVTIAFFVIPAKVSVERPTGVPVNHRVIQPPTNPAVTPPPNTQPGKLPEQLPPSGNGEVF